MSPAPTPKPNAPPSAISVRNLRVKYGEREILHGISFEVPAGETLVILGGSGSGKSTLLRTLVGLETPSSGEIWIQNKDFASISDERARRITEEDGDVVPRRGAVWVHDRW